MHAPSSISAGRVVTSGSELRRRYVLSSLVNVGTTAAVGDPANRFDDFAYGAFAPKPEAVVGRFQRPCAPSAPGAESKPEHPKLFTIDIGVAKGKSGAHWRCGEFG